ncbi:MAG: SAM-dependent chlorinase/fluorinase [Bacteroidia bacterium]|nr:SAM-dependent chlorinase/fluorinase [Bacteroidia bacterium]
MLPIILISDNNVNDIYNSVLKYHILSQWSQVNILEYCVPSTSSDKLNYVAAYILLNEHHFLPNTIFFVEVNIHKQMKQQKILLIQYNQKWILTPDSGILGLLEKEKIEKIFYWKEYISTSFYAKNEMLNALKNIVDSKFNVGKDFSLIDYNLCEKIFWPSVVERVLNDKEKNLIAPILYIDSYQNLIYHFKKTDFEKYVHEYDLTIKLPLSESVNVHYTTYNQEKTNCPLAFFNDAGYLEIAVNGGVLAPLALEQSIYTGATNSILLNLKKKKDDKANSQNVLSGK